MWISVMFLVINHVKSSSNQYNNSYYMKTTTSCEGFLAEVKSKAY